jgi:protein-disulfide isomerase
MKQFLRYGTAAALPLLLAAALAAQPQQNEPGITRQQADEILNELRQIRQLLEKQNRPSEGEPAKQSRIKLDLRNTPMLGSKDAPLTIVEFTDYQCPFCQRFHSQTFGELKKTYIDTGKVRFYSRDLPLDSLHPNATRAAQAARCANDQGKFWDIREIMSAHPDQLDMDSLVADAQQLKLDIPKFKSCVESDKYKNEVQSDVLEAMKIGADGTPAFVIGKSTPEGVDGDMLVGAQPYAMFDMKLKALQK